MTQILFAVALALAPSEGDRVGHITIEGNRKTADAAILPMVDLRPGALLPREADLLKAEIRLLMEHHKRFDLDGGHRPTIQVLPRSSGSVFRDVVVRFPERK